MKIISNNTTFVMQIYDFIKFFFLCSTIFFYFMLKYQSSELKAEKFAPMERFWESNFSSCSITSSITIFLPLLPLFSTVLIQLLLLLYALCLPIHFVLLKYWNNFISAMPSYHRSQRNCQLSIFYERGFVCWSWIEIEDWSDLNDRMSQRIINLTQKCTIFLTVW